MLKSLKTFISCQQHKKLQAKIAKEQKLEACSDKVRCCISVGTTCDFYNGINASEPRNY